ncbi:hypothetical protein U9M48_037341 [Paspalum notatum var. saurae]|uniref:Ankyrin-1 n=1 Tax=Paspalum notatum var. saurae TaxID=547442 RepID=A0AAQ3UG81_PASNO
MAPASRPSHLDVAVALQAATDGDLRHLKKMASRVDLRDATDAGLSALHFAAANGHLEVCKFLVEELGCVLLELKSCAGASAFVSIHRDSTRRPLCRRVAGPSRRDQREGERLDSLRYLIDRGADPGMPDSKGATPLHCAAEEGHCEAVRLLLSKGVDVDPVFRHGTPVHLAILNDHDQIVKILLEHGADPNNVSNTFSPLVLACCGYSLKCMKLLVEAGADVNFICPTGESILMVAVNGGSTDIVKFLLETGADPNVPDTDGQFPIMLTAAHKHRELVEILFPHTRPIPVVQDWSIDGIIVTMKTIGSKPQVSVEKQVADLKSQGKEAFARGDYYFAFYIYRKAMQKDPLDATLIANLSLCWLRLGEGERTLLDARQCRIMCPRWSKAWYREGSALSLLKDYKGAVDSFMQALQLDPASDEIKKALRQISCSILFLFSAAIDGNLHLLKKVASRVDLRDAKDAGRSALHLAAANGHLGVCRFLVEELGFGVNSTCAAGGSPVLYAAANGRESVLRYLIDRGADPGMPDSKGATPLHHAAEQGHCEAVRLLLSKGVDVDPVFGHGTPLHLALAIPNDRDQIVKILLEHGADPNKVSNAFSPLALACCGYSLKCMKLLVEAGADVNFICPTGESILMVAVDGGSTDIVKFLLEAGADPNVADKDGQLPIMLAADHKHRELVEILFPHTRPIPVVPDWSIDGITVAMKSIKSKPQVSVEKQVADLKSQGKEAFARGDYLFSSYIYRKAMEEDPLDATLFANRSLCWLRLREGEQALLDARQCRIMCPRWSKAWYREGAALSLLKDYKGAVDSFMQALHLDPASDEIKKAPKGSPKPLRVCRRRPMAPTSRPLDSDVGVALQAAVDGNLRLLKEMASRVDLRDANGAGQNALHLAAASGRLEVCRFLVEELGLGLNSCCASGGSPVIYAASNGMESVLRYLIDRGADPGMPDSMGCTPLHYAAEEGHCESVRTLLSKGVDVDPLHIFGTPLHWATALGHCRRPGSSYQDPAGACPTSLLMPSHHSDWRAAEDGLFPIMLAALHEYRELVEILFPCTKLIPAVPSWSIDGIIVTMKYMRSKPRATERDPLDATLFANRSLCWLRLGDGDQALLDARQCTMMRPCWSKAWYHEGMALSLLKNYKEAADAFMQAQKLDPVNDEIKKAIRQISPSTQPLSRFSNRRIASILCAPFSPLPKPSPPPSPLRIAMAPASKPSDSDVAVALLAAGAGNLHLLKMIANKVNLREVKDDEGLNALHHAALNGHLEVCRFLVEESGIDVNSTSGRGTPIHYAAAGGDVRVLGYLLDRGGDPAIQDSRGGSTPLHDAAVHGHCEAVRLLLSKGVDVDQPSCRGTALHSAAAIANDMVIKILLEHGADPNKFFHNIFPLMVACTAKSLKCMKLLVEAGADVNYICPSGPSILTAAADQGLTDIVKFLLDAGADPNIADKDGTFPIMAAAAKEHRELVEILFPRTRPIPDVPDWSIDGIIFTVKYRRFQPQEPVGKQLADAKSRAKEAFANGDFLYAAYFYEQAIRIDPLNATLFANRSLCWLRLREGENALKDARDCKALRPDWAKAWYREGASLSLLKGGHGVYEECWP